MIGWWYRFWHALLRWVGRLLRPRQVGTLLAAQQADPPHQLGRFRLGGALARGGHGRLYYASRDGGDDRFVVKAARDDTGSRIAEQAIAHEADVLALLRGHGVPILRDSAVDAWFGRYLVMDLVEGGQLGLLRPHADGIRWLRLMRRLSARLAYLHQRGVAHNDLRFENVLVDAQERPWLIDFAMARLAITDNPAASSAFAEACGRDVAQLRAWVIDTPPRALSQRQRRRLKRLNSDPHFQSATAAEMTAQLARVEDGRLLRGEKRFLIRRRIQWSILLSTLVLTLALAFGWVAL